MLRANSTGAKGKHAKISERERGAGGKRKIPVAVPVQKASKLGGGGGVWTSTRKQKKYCVAQQILA